MPDSLIAAAARLMSSQTRHSNIRGSAKPQETQINEVFTEEETEAIERLGDLRFKQHYVGKLHAQAFPSANQKHVQIPIDNSEDYPITTDNYKDLNSIHRIPETNFVITTLKNKGYHVHDYAAGLVSHESDPKRKIRVSKALANREHFTDEESEKISRTFTKDPTRTGAKSLKDSALFVTRDKPLIVGMGAGSKGFKSCLDPVEGCNLHYNATEHAHGTLAAYVVSNKKIEKFRKAGHEDPVGMAMQEATGRVALRPFHSINEDEHVILRPDNSSHGTVHPKIKRALNAWADQTFAAKPNTIYRKNDAVYNDDGRQYVGTQSHAPSYDAVISHIAKIRDNTADIAYAAYNTDNDSATEYDDIASNVSEFINHLNAGGYGTDQDHFGKNNNDGLANIKDHITNVIIDNRLKGEESKEDDDDWSQSVDNTPAHELLTHALKSHARNQHSLSVKNMVAGLSPEQVRNHLLTAEENHDKVEDYDAKEAAAELHGELIHHALKNINDPALHEHIISHILEHHNNNHSWYNEMDTAYGNYLSPSEHQHLLAHTNNPKSLKRMFDAHIDGSNMPNEFPELEDLNYSTKRVFLKKLGNMLPKEDVAHVMQHLDYDTDEGKHVISGINERHDGEEVTHHLIGELNLGPGHAEHGALKDIGQGYGQVVQYREKTSDLANRPKFVTHHDGYEDTGNSEKYADIARFTKFKSVHDALRTRPDTMNDETIQAGVRGNQLHK